MEKHQMPHGDKPPLDSLDIDLHREGFYGQILRELSGTLEDIVGLKEAEGFITVVAGRLGNTIDKEYRGALQLDKLPRNMLSDVLVDLKRRIGGNFSIEYEDDDKIILRNTRCPYGPSVLNRPSLCMMTTNVFGRLTANNTGYARVRVVEAISHGDPGCRVVINLKPADDEALCGIEFFDAV